jgi:GxxExxY protein
MLEFSELTEEIIGAAIEVHRFLGPGPLESVYEECMCHELRLRGLGFERQVGLPVRYKGVPLDVSLRMDLVVERLVVVELKSIERILPVHEAQLLTYLKLSGFKVGLLLNFNVALLRDGVLRRALSMDSLTEATNAAAEVQNSSKDLRLRASALKGRAEMATKQQVEELVRRCANSAPSSRGCTLALRRGRAPCAGGRRGRGAVDRPRAARPPLGDGAELRLLGQARAP